MGSFHTEFVETYNSSLPSLMAACTSLSPEDTAAIVDDFEHGRAHLLSIVSLKMQPWKVLPWRLVALGDWDEERLKSTAAVILEEFGQCEEQSKHHRITWFFLRPGSALRLGIEGLASGQPMNMFPALRPVVVGWLDGYWTCEWGVVGCGL